MKNIKRDTNKHGSYNNGFYSIELPYTTRLKFCKSHSFIFSEEDEKRKLSNAEPCFYTDDKYSGESSRIGIGKRNKKTKSLKTAIRHCNKYKEYLPKGVIFNILNKNYLIKKSGKTQSLHVEYKPKSDSKVFNDYEITQTTELINNFNNDEKLNELVTVMRNLGFLVYVSENTYEGNTQALAYGHNKMIGFSELNTRYNDYYNGKDYILWDNFDEFNKWSTAEEISKDLSINEIIELLIPQENLMKMKIKQIKEKRIG